MARLSNQQRKELRALQRRLPLCSWEYRGEERFILEYIAFEAQARKLWHYYRCRRKLVAESESPLPLQEIKKAMEHFDMQVRDGILELLLDSKLTKRGEKSARQLRNGMVHRWLKEDCREAAERCVKFSSLFDNFKESVEAVL